MSVNITGSPLDFEATLNDSQFHQSLNRMERDLNRTSASIKAQGDDIEAFGKKAASAAAAFFSVQAASGFISSLVDVRSQFQQLDIAFSTMLKSKVASDKLMKELIVFAGTTPFGLKDAAGAAKQLLAYGSTAKSVVGELRMLGDVASGVSVPIGDLVYLYGTLKTQGRAYAMDIRQFAGRGIPIYAELAKVLGVAKDQVAGLVEAGKIGFPQVEQAFKNMTAAGGMFGGLMEAQSKTLTGQIERLKDAWDLMLNEIGKSNEGVLSGSISLASKLVENYQSILDILQVLIITYGTYRAAIVLTSVISLTAIEASAGVTAAMKLQYLWLNLCSKAQRIFNATMLANPYVAVATAVAALVSAMYIYNRSVDDAVNAQKKVNAAIDEGRNSVMSETIKIKDSIKAISDSTAALTVKQGAINDLRKIMPDYLKAYSDEEILAGKATTAIMAYNDALVNSAISKALFDQKVKIELDKMKAQNMNIDDEDTGFGLTEIIFKNKSFNEYKKDQINAQNELLKANEAAIKSHNERIADLNKKEESKPIVQNKKFYEDQVSGIQGQIDGLDKLDKEFSSKKADLLTKLKTAKNGLAAFDTSDKQANKDFDQAKRYFEMLQKIYEINEKYNNKSLTDDEQKLAEIRSQYKSLRTDIDAYNKDPKNKKVNIDLKPAMEKAIEVQQYSNDTEKLKIEIEKQKQLYTDYEDYKTSLGKTAADARYKNEIDTTVNFLQKLEAERGKLLDKDPTKMTGPELERLKVYDQLINEEVAAERKKQDDLTKSLISYQQERLNIIAKYQADLLTIENDPAAKAERTTRFNEGLKDLDDSHIKKLDSYKLLFEGIDQLSEENARKVIANAGNLLDELIKKGIGSPELRRELARLLKQSTDALDQRLPGKLIDLAGQIGGIANSVSLVDEEFGKVLGTLGNVLSQVGNIKKGIKDFGAFGSKGDTLGQLGAGLGILGAGISIFSSVFKLFDRSAQREEQAAYARDLQNKQTEALNKALERQVALLDEVYGTERITKYAEAFAQATANQEKYLNDLSGKFLLTDNNEVNKLIQKINNGEKASNIFEKLAMSDLLKGGSLQSIPKDIEQLRTLLAEGKLDANTAVIVQNLIQANELSKELANNMTADRVGSSLTQIADDFISTLTDGTQDFGKSFEEVIKRSLLNGFKSKFIQDHLQGFYDKFDELAKGGLTDQEIASLNSLYLQMGEEGKKKLEELEKITGIKLGGDPNISNSDTMRGRIESITSTQADKLEGQFNGFRLIQLETNSLLKSTDKTTMELLNIAKGNFDTFKRIEANTLRTADNTSQLKRLEKVENTLVSIDKKMDNNSNSMQATGRT